MAIIHVQDGIVGTSKLDVLKALKAFGYELLTCSAYRNPITNQVEFICFRAGFWFAPVIKNGLLSLTSTAMVGILQDCEIAVPEGSTPLQLAHMIASVIPATMLPIVFKAWQ
jgi:hypothetical protein